MDDRFEFAQAMLSTVVRLGHGDFLVKAMIEAGGKLSEGSEDTVTADIL